MKGYIIICLLLLSCGVAGQQSGEFPAPICADPYYCVSCDLEIVWNSATGEWLFFYTGRRLALGVAVTCGNPIGVAASRDFQNWAFKGNCLFDGKE